MSCTADTKRTAADTARPRLVVSANVRLVSAIVCLVFLLPSPTITANPVLYHPILVLYQGRRRFVSAPARLVYANSCLVCVAVRLVTVAGEFVARQPFRPH